MQLLEDWISFAHRRGIVRSSNGDAIPEMIFFGIKLLSLPIQERDSHTMEYFYGVVCHLLNVNHLLGTCRHVLMYYEQVNEVKREESIFGLTLPPIGHSQNFKSRSLLSLMLQYENVITEMKRLNVSSYRDVATVMKCGSSNTTTSPQFKFGSLFHFLISLDLINTTVSPNPNLSGKTTPEVNHAWSLMNLRDQNAFSEAALLLNAMKKKLGR